MIYLASPYSKYPHGRHAAFVAVTQKAAELILEGNIVFCPIAHTHPIEMYSEHKMPDDGDFWLRQDFAILQHCDELVVYCMPGWTESYGVGEEITYAKKNNIPIRYLDYDIPGTSW